MLLRMMAMLSIAAMGLALAACAETGGALATAVAVDAASIAATQAIIATTQAIEALDAASTRMSSSQANANAIANSLPHLPRVGKGTLIINTPTALIVQKNGKRYIFLKPPSDDNEEADH